MNSTENKTYCEKNNLREGVHYYCIKNRWSDDKLLFKKDVIYEFICKHTFSFNDYAGIPKVHEDYILDRVDNGKREIFYQIEKFKEYFVPLRKIKIDKINEQETGKRR